MMEKLSAHVVDRTVAENQNKDGSGKKPKKTRAYSAINLEYVEGVLQKLFALRQADVLSSRVRFMIQDLIDLYQRDWKEVIYGERN